MPLIGANVEVNAISPNRDIAAILQGVFLPVLVFCHHPCGFQTANGDGRQSAGCRAEQGR
jgi:hypothetical protein